MAGGADIGKQLRAGGLGGPLQQSIEAGLRDGEPPWLVHQSLSEALVAFLAEVPKVGKPKTATVPTKSGGSYKYAYADLGTVTDAAYPILTRHGLAFTCRSRLAETGKYEIVGVLTHTSGQEREAALPLFGNSPQELGSSITYARRYLLGMMTGLVTDEDTDAAGANHEPTRGQEPPPPPPADPVSIARGRAWGAYRQIHGDAADMGQFREFVERFTAQPFEDTTPEQFDRFAREIQEGTQP